MMNADQFLPDLPHRADRSATWAVADIEQATLGRRRLLKHPNWSMGQKITIDFRVDDEQGARGDRGLLSVRADAG